MVVLSCVGCAQRLLGAAGGRGGAERAHGAGGWGASGRAAGAGARRRVPRAARPARGETHTHAHTQASTHTRTRVPTHAYTLKIRNACDLHQQTCKHTHKFSVQKNNLI